MLKILRSCAALIPSGSCCITGGIGSGFDVGFGGAFSKVGFDDIFGVVRG